MCLEIESQLVLRHAWELESLRDRANTALEVSKKLTRNKECRNRVNTRGSEWKETRRILEG